MVAVITVFVEIVAIDVAIGVVVVAHAGNQLRLA